jgi:hypothetical protein
MNLYWTEITTVLWYFQNQRNYCHLFFNEFNQKTIIMSRFVHDSTTDFQGRSFSSHKPYILDPGGSATTDAQKLGPLTHIYKFNEIFILFNDSAFSPVWSGLINTESKSVRLQCSFEEIYLNSKEETKLSQKRQCYKVVLSIFPTKTQETCTKTGWKHELVGNWSPGSR